MSGALVSSNIKNVVTGNKDRLLALNLLPLTYDRETRGLIFFFKLLNGYYDINVSNYVSFVSHSRTRNCENPSLMNL